MAFVPMPFQMIPAAALAIVFRANIIVSVALVWISNPITMPPLFYFCYLLGARILGQQPGRMEFEISFDWLASELMLIWQPFLLGCFIVGSIMALIGYFGMHGVWRLYVVREWAARKDIRRARRKAARLAEQANTEEHGGQQQ